MSIADEVFELFDRYGSNTYSEQVSIVAHSRQAAALAREAGASDGLVVAALLLRLFPSWTADVLQRLS